MPNVLAIVRADARAWLQAMLPSGIRLEAGVWSVSGYARPEPVVVVADPSLFSNEEFSRFLRWVDERSIGKVVVYARLDRTAANRILELATMVPTEVLLEGYDVTAHTVRRAVWTFSDRATCVGSLLRLSTPRLRKMRQAARAACLCMFDNLRAPRKITDCLAPSLSLRTLAREAKRSGFIGPGHLLKAVQLARFRDFADQERLRLESASLEAGYRRPQTASDQCRSLVRLTRTQAVQVDISEFASVLFAAVTVR